MPLQVDVAPYPLVHRPPNDLKDALGIDHVALGIQHVQRGKPKDAFDAGRKEAVLSPVGRNPLSCDERIAFIGSSGPVVDN